MILLTILMAVVASGRSEALATVVLLLHPAASRTSSGIPVGLSQPLSPKTGCGCNWVIPSIVIIDMKMVLMDCLIDLLCCSI